MGDTLGMCKAGFNHEALKADKTQWITLTHIGNQRYDYSETEYEVLEMRNCKCGSTLAVIIEAHNSVI